MTPNMANLLVVHWHDWFMYVQSGIDDTICVIMQYKERRFHIYSEPGYNNGWYLKSTFQESIIDLKQQEFNSAMSSVQITVDWTFKSIMLYSNI